MIESRYLKVAFMDNDFGTPVQAAVTRLWKDIRDNNAHLLVGIETEYESSRTLADIFYELLKCGALKTMLNRAVDAEDHYSDVEFATRGLYHPKVQWGKHRLLSKHFNALTTRYLTLKLSLHPERSTEWANHEELWLDTMTGEVVFR